MPFLSIYDCRLSALAAAFAALTCTPAFAQGTDAQREACAPDAIKLCSDVIPDVPKTTVCMRRHYAELSSRCRVAFDAALPATGNSRARGRAAMRETVVVTPPASAPADDAIDVGTIAEPMPGLRAYRARIRQVCREGLVDAFTCRNTLDLLQAGD